MTPNSCEEISPRFTRESSTRLEKILSLMPWHMFLSWWNRAIAEAIHHDEDAPTATFSFFFSAYTSALLVRDSVFSPASSSRHDAASSLTNLCYLSVMPLCRLMPPIFNSKNDDVEEDEKKVDNWQSFSLLGVASLQWHRRHATPSVQHKTENFLRCQH